MGSKRRTNLSYRKGKGHHRRTLGPEDLVAVKMENIQQVQRTRMVKVKSSEPLSELLLRNEVPYDATFITQDGVPIAAHKIVLALASKHFATLFAEEKPHKMTTIHVPDFSAATMFRIVNLCYNNNKFAPFSTHNELMEFADSLPSFGLTLADFHGGDSEAVDDDATETESLDGDSMMDSMTDNYGSSHDSSLLSNYQNQPGPSSSSLVLNPLSYVEESSTLPTTRLLKGFKFEPDFGSPPILERQAYHDSADFPVGRCAVSPGNRRFQAGSSQVSTNRKRKQPQRQESRQVQVKTERKSNLGRKQKKAPQNNAHDNNNNLPRVFESIDEELHMPSSSSTMDGNEESQSLEKFPTLSEFGDSPIEEIGMNLDDADNILRAKFCPVCLRTKEKFNEVSYCLERKKIYRCCICLNSYKSKVDKDNHMLICHKIGDKYRCPFQKCTTREFGSSGNVLQHLCSAHWKILN